MRQQTEEALKEGRLPRRGGDGVAGAGHRHGGGRSGLPGRVAGQRRARLAARRPGRAPRRPDRARAGSSPRRRRPARTGRAGREMAAGRVEAIRVPQQLPRRAGPADRRHGGDGRLGRAGPLSPGPPGLSLPRPVAAGVRAVLEMVSGPLPLRRRDASARTAISRCRLRTS